MRTTNNKNIDTEKAAKAATKAWKKAEETNGIRYPTYYEVLQEMTVPYLPPDEYNKLTSKQKSKHQDQYIDDRDRAVAKVWLKHNFANGRMIKDPYEAWGKNFPTMMFFVWKNSVGMPEHKQLYDFYRSELNKHVELGNFEGWVLININQ
jgi:hypothetical protein